MTEYIACMCAGGGEGRGVVSLYTEGSVKDEYIYSIAEWLHCVCIRTVCYTLFK